MNGAVANCSLIQRDLAAALSLSFEVNARICKGDHRKSGAIEENPAPTSKIPAR